MLFSNKKSAAMNISGKGEIKDEVKRSSLQNISSCIYQSSVEPVFIQSKKGPVLFPISREVKMQVLLPDPSSFTPPTPALPNAAIATSVRPTPVPSLPTEKRDAFSKAKEPIAVSKSVTYEDIQQLVHASIANIPDVVSRQAIQEEVESKFRAQSFTKQDVLAWIEAEIENKWSEERKKSDSQKEETILPIVENYLAKIIEEDSRILLETDDTDLSEGARSKFEEMIEPAVGRIVQRIIKYDYEQDKIGFNETASMNLDINYDEVYDYEQQEKSHFEAPLLVPQPPGMYNPMYETAAELTVPPENDLDIESFYKAKGEDGKVFYVNELRSEYKSRKWIRFGNGIETGNVLDMVLDKTNKKIYIVGHFKHVNRIPIENVAVYDVKENVWSHVGNGISSVATCVAIYEEAQILFVGGVFTKVGKGENVTPANNIAAFYILENRWISLGDGLNRDCTSLVFDTKTEKLYAGGTFTQTGTQSMHYVGIYSLKTNCWTGLVGGEINGPCRCLMLANDTELYIGGLFTHAGKNDTYVSYVAKYNLEERENPWSDLAGGLQGYCNTLAYDPVEGVVYVGGTFNSVGAKESTKDAHHIAKFRLATQTWETMNGGVNNVVNSLSYDEKDKCLYIGGAFTHTFEDNILLNHIGKFVPETDTWAPLANHFKNCKIPTDDKGNDNIGLNGVCRVMNLDDTSLFVAGSFQIAGSITANSIVRYVVKRGGGD
jgi:hypothetical protein